MISPKTPGCHLDMISSFPLSSSRNAMTVILKRQQSLALIHTVNAALALSQSAGKWHCCSSSRMCGRFLSVDNVAIFISCPVILLHFLCLSWRSKGCHQIRSAPNYLCCVMFWLHTAKNIHMSLSIAFAII